jgi:hypothetical protein
MPTGIRQTKEGTYQARIKIKGQEKSKTFKTIEEAIEQRKRWEEQLHPVAPVAPAPVAQHHRILPFAKSVKTQAKKHAEAQARYRAKKLKENAEEFRANHVKEQQRYRSKHKE